MISRYRHRQTHVFLRVSTVIRRLSEGYQRVIIRININIHEREMPVTLTRRVIEGVLVINGYDKGYQGYYKSEYHVSRVIKVIIIPCVYRHTL